eukprot:TRINITY_DN19752_c0_g1_i1.p1 TRINITY_DN19752_c0_g1~~TRINITY_DN19752_c0_g1_i1.p1  ORF type:complete len:143 (+),score=42.56 TRINITY_DN19752_c0_g1_i1:86-514(+)
MHSHFFFFFQAEDGIRDAQESRGLGDVYKRQVGYDRSEDGVAQQVARLGNLMMSGQVQAVRMTGGCCNNLCSIACGRMDAYYEGRDATYGPKPWDWAASSLILKEAGGWIGSFAGGELDIFSGCGVATAGEPLRDELLPLLK